MTVSTTIASTLAARRAALEQAVDELTIEQKAPAPTTEDPGRRALVPPLLTGVEEAQMIGGRRVRAPRSNAGRSPGWITATRLIVDIDAAIGPAVGTRAGWSRRRRLRAWAARVGSSPSLDAVDAAAERATWWAAAGRALFESPRWLPLRGATCPDCGRDRFVDGDGTISAVLIADTTTGAVCCTTDGCGASWPAEHLHLLARALGVQTTTDVLAVEPDPESEPGSGPEPAE